VDVRTGGPIDVTAQHQVGSDLTGAVVEFCQEVFDLGGAILCGPGGGRFVYDLRTRLKLYCKLIPLRPWRALKDTGPLRPERLEGVDIVVVRENVSGLYFGSWGIVSQSDNCRVAYHHSSYREDEVERILTVALALARQRRNKLDVITKPGGIPAISQLWQEKLQELNHDEGVATRVLEIDNAAYQLIAHPEDFDVVACPNLFGDVLGDCGSLLLGSRGLSFSGNFGGCGCAVYQTAHGAAWPLAGIDRANPIGQICSLAMMLRESCDLPVAAEAIEQAIELTLARGVRVADIASPGCRVVGTREMGRRICESLLEVLGGRSL
jgi:3-isopropylmalate dehydrogenase